MCSYGILENYESLGAGVVKFALNDYTSTIESLCRYYEKLDKFLDENTKAVKHHQRVGDICLAIYKRIENLNEIEKFLSGDWVKSLTSLDIEYVFEKVKKKLKEKGYKVNIMGLIVSTDEHGVKIFAHEKEGANGNFTSYTLGINTKDQNGNWINGYISCRFKKGITVPNKTKIKINKSFFVASRSNNKSYTHLMITDFDVLEPGDSEGGEDFMKIPEGAADDAPFL